MPERRRNAIVTGSAGALGRALSVRLAREGRRLVLIDRAADRNRETAAAVVAAGGEAECQSFDVADRDAWRSLYDRLRRDWQHVDLLVNNAGVAAAGEVGLFSLDDWDWALDVNLRSVIYGCHTFLPWLRENPDGGHVLNTASFAAFASLPSMAAYNVTKAGVLSLSETLRTELAATNVGVTVVCPGFFSSGLLKQARMHTDGQREFAEEAMRQATISADDVAAAALQAVRKKQFYVILPLRAKIIWRLKRFLPGAYFRYLRFRCSRMQAEES